MTPLFLETVLLTSAKSRNNEQGCIIVERRLWIVKTAWCS